MFLNVTWKDGLFLSSSPSTTTPSESVKDSIFGRSPGSVLSKQRTHHLF